MAGKSLFCCLVMAELVLLCWVQEVSGIPSPCCPKGEKGEKGNQGPQGSRGNSGPPGAVGVRGLPGFSGQRGGRGAKGDTGEKGDSVGPRGTKGPEGYQGPTGDPGNPGEKGDTGLKGDFGEPGTPGRRGPVGDTGTPGPRGGRGDTGAPGEQGPKGALGAIGPQGIPGKRGDKGDPGPPSVANKGEMGSKGNQGPTGSRGSTGPPGSKGEKGIKGGKGVKGEQGDPGQRGPQGPPGREGEKGRKGAKGRQGESKPGQKGEKGGKGEKGPKGAFGPNGIKGIQGEKGREGCKGERGRLGRKGSSGASGTSFFFWGDADCPKREGKEKDTQTDFDPQPQDAEECRVEYECNNLKNFDKCTDACACDARDMENMKVEQCEHFCQNFSIFLEDCTCCNKTGCPNGPFCCTEKSHRKRRGEGEWFAVRGLDEDKSGPGRAGELGAGRRRQERGEEKVGVTETFYSGKIAQLRGEVTCLNELVTDDITQNTDVAVIDVDCSFCIINDRDVVATLYNTKDCGKDESWTLEYAGSLRIPAADSNPNATPICVSTDIQDGFMVPNNINIPCAVCSK